MKARWLAVIGSLILPGVAIAHHGDAERYNQQAVTISGTVVELRMINPHTVVVFDVEQDGKVVRWQAELGGPQQLTRDFGWNRTTIKQGDRLTLTGRQAKSGAPYLNLTERANIVMTATGKEIFRTPNFGTPATP